MKKIILLAVSVCVLFMPGLAQALHHLVIVSAVVRVSATDCAVELTITGDGQNAFVTSDNIEVDGTTLVDLTAVVDAGIDGTSGHHNSGDRMLAGSNSFDTSHGINADMVFDDSGCATIDADALVEFFNNGSTTLIDTINTSSVSGFGDNTAISKTSTTATPTLVDLATSTLVVGNNAGETATLGTSGGGTSGGATASSGGCSLIPR